MDSDAAIGLRGMVGKMEADCSSTTALRVLVGRLLFRARHGVLASITAGVMVDTVDVGFLGGRDLQMLDREALVRSTGNLGARIGSLADGARDALVLLMLLVLDDLKFPRYNSHYQKSSSGEGSSYDQKSHWCMKTRRSLNCHISGSHLEAGLGSCSLLVLSARTCCWCWRECRRKESRSRGNRAADMSVVIDVCKSRTLTVAAAC